MNFVLRTTSWAVMLCLAACATPTQSRRAVAGGGFAAGALIGAATAPKDEKPELHAALWAGLLGLAGALGAEYFFSDDSEMARLRKEREELRAELEVLKTANTVLIKEGQGYFKNAPEGAEFQSGKAKWRLFRIDRWSKEGPHRLIHQDRLVEIVPESGNGP